MNTFRNRLSNTPGKRGHVTQAVSQTLLSNLFLMDPLPQVTKATLLWFRFTSSVASLPLMKGKIWHTSEVNRFL